MTDTGHSSVWTGLLSSLLWPLWVPVPHSALQRPHLPSSSSGPSSFVCAVWTDPASACVPGQTWYQRHHGKCSSSSWAAAVKKRSINDMSVCEINFYSENIFSQMCLHTGHFEDIFIRQNFNNPEISSCVKNYSNTATIEHQ